MTFHPDTPLHFRDQIVTGDARELARLIPDCSVDLVFTDPPYPKEYLPLYGWLAEEAARVLKPGGFCIAYLGGAYLADVVTQMAPFLTYHWHLSIYQTADNYIMWPRKIMSGLKLLLAWSKGPSAPRCLTRDVFVGTKADKFYHAWGQDVVTARYYVDCFSGPGQVVYDPFMGGGTTAVVCKVLQRRFLGNEIDPDVAERARKRVEQTQPPLFVLSEEQATMELTA